MTTRDEWLESLSPEHKVFVLELMTAATEACVEDIKIVVSEWKKAVDVFREGASGLRTGGQNDDAGASGLRTGGQNDDA